tara:strand:- start:2915 stop:3139 length:225 start_codon:yes stop_codon:yes gene_type:complete
MEYKGEYIVHGDHYCMTIIYIYYWEEQTSDYVGSADLEVDEVWLNNQDITDFYHDYLANSLEEELIANANENKD